MAYAINDIADGYYTLLTFKSESNFPIELRRVAGITDNVLRCMAIRLDGVEEAAEAAPAAEEPAAE
jgi:small subunit ribosomal protein S6